MSTPRKRVVVFISGGGSNMMALVAAAKAADYPAEIVGVISDKAEAGGLAKAAAEGIATFAFPRKDYASKDAHEAAIFSALDELSPDILCLAGYMRLLTPTFIQRYEGRMLNIHLPCCRCFRACTPISAPSTPACALPAAPYISSPRAWTKAR